jgi:hypothetical protein
MWKCTGCLTERQWGFGFPESPTAEPLLVCEGTCSAKVAAKSENEEATVVMPHKYTRVQGVVLEC